MAKKFVRGITDIKNIEHQDFDTNNVNDLLSDGKHNYIHRKKQDGTEEYHNLTNNIKTIESSNTSLLSVTNFNNSTNSARLTPKHDRRKEQLLESTDETIVISHGENGTEETTSVDVNPAKVLEHENLVSNSDYVTIQHEEGSNISQIKTDELDSKIIEIEEKIPTQIGCRNLLTGTNQGRFNWVWHVSSGVRTVEDYNVDGINAVKFTRTSDEPATLSYIGYHGLLSKHIEPNTKYTLSFDAKANIDVTFTVDLKRADSGAPLTDTVEMNTALANQWTKLSCILTSKSTLPDDLTQIVYFTGMPTGNGNSIIIKNIKLEKASIASDWTPAPEDFDTKLAQKQNTLTSNTSIGVDGTGLMQLYSYEMSYSKPLEGSLNTYAKTVQKDTTLTADPKLEYHFTAKLNDAIAGMTVELEDDDVTYFTSILDSYGQTSASGKRAMINGLLFTLNGSQLTVSRDVSSTAYNQVVSFSDIIDPSQNVE